MSSAPSVFGQDGYGPSATLVGLTSQDAEGVESLATQTLVIFVIRTMGNPLKSRPSLPLAITTILIVATGIFLPYSPFTRLFGFVPLPTPFFVFLAVSTVTYLVLVEFGKRVLRLG